MNKEDFYNYLKSELNIELSDLQKNKLDKFANLLLEYNKHTNITAIRDKEGVYLKHFYDSLTILRIIDLNNDLEVLDLGSGGGFPGIVIGIVFSNLKITLLDSNHKKTDFQNYIIDKLNLNNIKTINDRAENYFKTGNKFDLVVARAVANLTILSELCIPFVKINGKFLAMKGSLDEIKDAEYAINFLGGSITKKDVFLLPKTKDERALVLIDKKIDSPIGYPRNYDKIIKKPLINR